MSAIVHARKQGSRYGPHRRGRITPENVRDADPRCFTLCGAAPTDGDLPNRSARTLLGRRLLTCADCARIVEADQ